MRRERPAWTTLPESVRREMQARLGAPVVEHRSQPGGFSPGTADRLRLANGVRAFVEAGHCTVNQDAVDLARREAGVAASLPAGFPAPALLRAFQRLQADALIHWLAGTGLTDRFR